MKNCQVAVIENLGEFYVLTQSMEASILLL